MVLTGAFIKGRAYREGSVRTWLTPLHNWKALISVVRPICKALSCQWFSLGNLRDTMFFVEDR
jgi:hypothetical protein